MYHWVHRCFCFYAKTRRFPLCDKSGKLLFMQQKSHKGSVAFWLSVRYNESIKTNEGEPYANDISKLYALDGTEQMSPRPGTDVAIENDRIAQIGKITPNKGDRVVDLTGKYLMPGLINLHVHLPAGGKPQNKPMNTNRLTKIALSSGLSRALVLRMCHAYAMQGLLSGVTTVRAVGGLDNLDTRARDRIHAGKLDGPRMLVANYAIGVPHGHMVGSVTHPAETVEDAVRMVDQLHGQNVDLIKLMITGGVMDAKVKGEPGRLMMQADMIKACLRPRPQLWSEGGRPCAKPGGGTHSGAQWSGLH